MKNKTGIFLEFNKGQAAVELAIFGSIILLAFSVLLMYGQRLESQQQVKMEAFRRALQKAYDRNGSVSYTLKKEGRSVNLFGGLGQGQSSTVAATASVLWQKGMPGAQDNEESESYSYYAINDNEIEFPRYPKQQKNLMGKDVTVYVPASVYTEEQVRLEQFAADTRKQESPGGGITNTKTSSLSDTVNTTLHVRVDTSYDDDPHDNVTPLPVYVYEGQTYNDTDMGQQTVQAVAPVSVGAYYRNDTNRIDYSNTTVGTTIHKERSWQTNN